MSDSPFYIGYHRRMPDALRRYTRRFVAIALLVAIVAPLALVASHRRANPGNFEFGVERSFRGWIEATPVPALLVSRPGGDERAGYSRFLLCGFGKFGVGDRVAGFEGKEVTLRGTLIARDGTTMVELAASPVEAVASPGPRPVFAEEDLGPFSLEGEIVDSKCWLGVMKPGEWKVHRACATRCIAGGVPPLFVVDREQGGSLQFLLVGALGEAVNSRILDLVAEPVAIDGRVVRRGATLFLYADPTTYRRRT